MVTLLCGFVFCYCAVGVGLCTVVLLPRRSRGLSRPQRAYQRGDAPQARDARPVRKWAGKMRSTRTMHAENSVHRQNRNRDYQRRGIKPRTPLSNITQTSVLILEARYPRVREDAGIVRPAKLPTATPTAMAFVRFAREASPRTRGSRGPRPM